jgi:hypothetical protein
MAREIEKEGKKMAQGMRGQRRYRATEGKGGRRQEEAKQEGFLKWNGKGYGEGENAKRKEAEVKKKVLRHQGRRKAKRG